MEREWRDIDVGTQTLAVCPVCAALVLATKPERAAHGRWHELIEFAVPVLARPVFPK